MAETLTVPSARCQTRTDAFARATRTLPGCTPQDNPRPLGVAARFDGLTLGEFLQRRHPHLSLDMWRQRTDQGALFVDGRLVEDLNRIVRAGNRLVHLIKDEVEPDVNAGVKFLFEDDDLLVVSKPAPLPLHPCGRFRRNTLVSMIHLAFEDLRVRPVHRLDADTTGLVLLAKSRMAAAAMGRQFEARTVEKSYLARVQGHPDRRVFSCDAPVTDALDEAGKRSVAKGMGRQGQQAHTAFQVMRHVADDALVVAKPHSGRTNQIRIHLAHLGHPIVGDQAFAGNQAFTSGASALCLHAWRLRLAHPRDGHMIHFQDQEPAWALGPPHLSR